MADINYGEYTWKDCEFNAKLNTTAKDAFWAKIGEILDCTMSVEGDYGIVTTTPSGGGEPYISAITLKDSNLCIKCVPNQMSANNADNWCLKVQSGDQEIRRQLDDDLLQVTCTPSGPKTITEINLGEKTAHKVYNSYRWWNQDTQTQESYWPWGCKLATKLPPESTGVSITNESPSAEFKQYSIPCFYVADQSVNGYGHYRKIQNANEELQIQEGYQTRDKLTPFESQRVRQMLFLSKQLFTKDMYHILLNEWDTVITSSMSTFPLHTITVQNNIVYINDKEVYQLQPGDKLIKYEMTPIDSQNLVANPSSRYGFFEAQIGKLMITYLEPAKYYSFSIMDWSWSERSFTNPIYSLVVDVGDFQTNEVYLFPSKEDGELKYYYTGKLPNVQYTLLWGDTLTTDEHSWLQESIHYTQAQWTCTYTSQDQSKDLYELYNNWRAYMAAGLEMQITIDIDNVPYFWLDGTPIYQSNNETTLEWSDWITPDPSTSSDILHTKVWHYKRVKLQDSPNTRYPWPWCFGNDLALISGGQLAHYDRVSYEEVLEVQCEAGVDLLPWPVYEQTSPLNLVVVWHFQTLSDKPTEGTGNGGSAPGPTPH